MIKRDQQQRRWFIYEPAAYVWPASQPASEATPPPTPPPSCDNNAAGHRLLIMAAVAYISQQRSMCGVQTAPPERHPLSASGCRPAGRLIWLLLLELKQSHLMEPLSWRMGRGGSELAGISGWAITIANLHICIQMSLIVTWHGCQVNAKLACY